MGGLIPLETLRPGMVVYLVGFPGPKAVQISRVELRDGAHGPDARISFTGQTPGIQQTRRAWDNYEDCLKAMIEDLKESRESYVNNLERKLAKFDAEILFLQGLSEGA